MSLAGTLRDDASRAGVRVQLLAADKEIPVLVQPDAPDLFLANWASGYREFVEELLRRYGALLFRDFRIDGIAGFETFVNAVSGSGRLPYVDRSTPREDRGDRIYTATTYPKERAIRLHNEGTYWRSWPRKLFFYCSRPAETGGETPIGDVSKVLRRIHADIRDEFERKQVMYIRNYNGGLGLTWEEVFQTDRPRSVEVYCRDNNIDFKWTGNNRLRTRQVRPAIRVNPETGGRVWFNHAAFFNVEALASDVRKVMLNNLSAEELPYNTYFGDGTPIAPEIVRDLLSAYDNERVLFQWQQGDVMLLDNMKVAHGRERYRGEREVLVAMTEPCEGDAAQST